MLLGLLASAAGGLDQGPDYQDRNYSVSGSRRFSSQANRTTFTFEVTGDGAAEYFLINACEPGTSVVRAFGPDDQQPVSDGPDQSTGHESLKFEPGNLGTYIVIYRDDINGAEFIIKNGNGHKHYYVGSGCPAGTEVTTSSRDESTATTDEKESTTTTEKESTTTTEKATTTTEKPTTTTEASTTTEAPTTTTEAPMTTEKPTTSTEAPPTSTEDTKPPKEPKPPKEDPTPTSEEPPTSVTLAGLPDPPRPGGSGTSTRLLLVGIPLALSGVAIRFGEPEESS